MHITIPITTLMTVFQITLIGWVSSLSVFFFHLIRKRTLMDKWPRFLSAGCSSCQSNFSWNNGENTKHWSQSGNITQWLSSSTTRWKGQCSLASTLAAYFTSTIKCNTCSWPSGCGLSLFVNSMIRLNPSFCFLQHAKPVTFFLINNNTSAMVHK